jgi:hypothetical protein
MGSSLARGSLGWDLYEEDGWDKKDLETRFVN